MIVQLRRHLDRLSEQPPRWLFALLWAVWLPFLIPSILQVVSGRYPAWVAGVGLADLAVFAGVYTWAAQANGVTRGLSGDVLLDPPLSAAWPVALLAVLSLASVLAFGDACIGMAIYTGAIIAPHFPTRRSAWLVGLWTVLFSLVALARHTGLPLIGQFALLTSGIGMSVVLLVHTARTARQLGEAQAEVARLAVAGERLRFARDLHDLLGHSLSLIALKCDLAQQLLLDAPEGARREVADAEQVARAALREVREAVAGYRQTGLAAEIVGAREVLAAAGIDLEYESTPPALPPEVESALTWTVREGVTNAVRHSRARHCRIQISRDGGDVSLTLSDDGHGNSETTTGSPGSGLAGLAERAAALGGSCEAGPDAGGGFRLSVRLPLAITRLTATASGVGGASG